VPSSRIAISSWAISRFGPNVSAAAGDAGDHAGQDHAEQRSQLVRPHAQRAHQVDHAVGLLGGQKADEERADDEVQHRQAGQPARLQQRVAPVVFDDEGGGGQRDRGDQCPAQPRRIQPPARIALCQYDHQQGNGRGEQGEGEEVHRLERLDLDAGRQLQHHHRRERAQGEAGFE
jgi:hypothetical protein